MQRTVVLVGGDKEFSETRERDARQIAVVENYCPPAFTAMEELHVADASWIRIEDTD